MKAIRLMREKHVFPFLKVHLHKAIPVGAGLGGGSSDAACILRAIIKHFNLDIENNNLNEMALQLGSDCPFFIDGTPSIGSGRGERLSSVEPVLSGFYLILMNPGLGINTAEAYKSCQPGFPSKSLMELVKLPVRDWKNNIVNDFEDFAFKKYPVIGNIKDELYKANALFSLMSGSGSSVYGIFEEKPAIPEKLRQFVIWEGMM
jgi:4-diphosphocytidyl-2-C-methyl-D-erythritol kinase